MGSAAKQLDQCYHFLFTEPRVDAVFVEAVGESRDAIVALAELPLQIRGFGPVKAANESKAAKRREEILAAIRDGGASLPRAAE